MAQQSYDLGPLNEPGHDTHFAINTKHIANVGDLHTRLTAAEPKLGGTFSPESYGAIGDGTMRALSTAYGTLPLAQAVYPKATALTQSIDGAAIQKAIDAATANGGGRVVLGVKRYICNGWTLVFPEAHSNRSAYGQPVSMVGQGVTASRLMWTADMGAGTYALSCGNPAGNPSNLLGRYASEGYYEGLWSDFSVEGPGSEPNHTAAPNPNAVLQRGIAWGSRRRMHRINSVGWWCSVSIVGDHCSFVDCYFRESYYGMYWDAKSPTLYGDNQFHKVMINGCGMAAIAAHPDAYIVGAFYGCYIGGSAYCMIKEAGAGSEDFMRGCVFIDCLFEWQGFGLLTDLAAVGSRRGVYDTRFIKVHYGPVLAMQYPGQVKEAIIDVGQMANVHMDIVSQYNWAPGTVALVRAAMRGCSFSVDLGGWLTAVNASAVPAFVGTDVDLATGNKFNDIGGGRAVLMVHNSGTGADIPTPGQLVQLAAGPFIRTSDGADTWPVVGLCLSKTTAGSNCVVLTDGFMHTAIKKGTVFTTGNYLVKSVATRGAADRTATYGPGVFAYYFGWDWDGTTARAILNPPFAV